MPKVERNKYFKNDKIVVKNNRTGKIRKLIFPHEVDFGLADYPEFAEKIKFYNGLSGSLTHLVDGTSYLIAGAGTSITTGSNGAITIQVDGTGGSGTITNVVAGTGLTGGGNVGSVTVDLDLNSLSSTAANVANDSIVFIDANDSNNPKKTTIADFINLIDGTGITPGSGGAAGTLNLDLDNISVATIDVSSDSFAFIDSSAGNATRKETLSDYIGFVANTGLAASSGRLSVDSSVIPYLANNNTFTGNNTLSGDNTLSGNNTLSGDNTHSGNNSFTGKNVFGVSSTQGLTGSLQEVSAGNPYLLAGTNIQLSTASNGQITIEATAVAPGASGGNTQIQFNDGGSSLGADSTFVFNKTSNTLTVPNISGSLTQLSDGSSYLIAGGATTITTGSNGAVTISSVNNEYNGGDGIQLNGGTLFEADLRTNGGLEFYLTQIQVDDSIVATLTGSDFSGTVKAPAFSGSLTQLEDGSSYLVAGDNISIITQSNGSIVISDAFAEGFGSIGITSGSTSIDTVSTIAASDGFILNDEGDGRAALTSSIGLSEDGTYTDGLFTDFTPQTRLGIAIDRFNEVLKSLAPSPAPDLDDINSLNTGISVLLSFGSSNDQSSATPAYASVAGTAGIASAVDVNGVYTVVTSSNNIRLGAFEGDTHVSGVLNADVVANSQGNNVQNYPAFSFAPGETGVLKLEVNGSMIKEIDFTVDLIGSGTSGIGTGSHLDANGSGFNFFSTATTGTFSNGNEFASFKHRTGQFVVASGSQRRGWNYARVLHVKTGSTLTTNYIEWVNDDNNDALTSAGNSISFEGSGSIHLSGVEYFRSGSAEYKVRVANAYKYVHDNNNITFTTSTGGSLNTSPSFSISDQSKPTINTGAGETHTKEIHVTGSTNITATQMLSGSITAGVNVTHPFKSDLSNAGQATDEGILIYNRTNNSTNTLETFRREDFRIISGAYNTQASLVDSGNVWDSTAHMTSSNGGHTNGLQFFNQRLYSPTSTLNSGDFSTFSNGPNENPNYSGITGQRTFYRWFRNTTGSTQYDFSIDIDGDSSTIVNAATALNAGRIRVFVKFPSNGTRETGWLDLATEFVLDSYADNDGAHTANGSLSFDSSLDALNYVTLGTVGIGNNEYIGLRIEADESWTGYVDQITVTFGAGTGTIDAVPDLDDIDCNDTGVEAALSFGSSKSISGYTNSGTTAGFSAVDLNGIYSVLTSSNNLRLSVFNKTTTIEGDLNEDVSAVSPDYPANSFSDANSGSLVLEVNGSDLHSVELTGSFNLTGTGEPGSGTGTSFTGNSGFFDLSVWRPAEFDNDVPFFLEIYRTAKFRVHTDDQRDGWNYVRVKHVGSWGARQTNYVEWINDSESQNNNVSSAGDAITQFGDDDIFHLSGVKYFVNPTGSIETRVSNVYKNVYSTSTSAVSLTSLTNANAVSIVQKGDGITSTKTENDGASALQTLNTNADSQNEVLHVTGTIQFSQAASLSGSFQSAMGVSNLSCGGRITFVHPIKNDYSIPSQTTTNMLVYSASDNSTHNTEFFNGEQYRIQSGTFATQNSITALSHTWSSTGSLNDNSSFPGYYSGLMVYGGLLISPLAGGESGKFRNKHEGSNTGIFEGPDNNVDYSTLGEDTREYFRYFENTSSNDLARFGITLRGDAEIVSRATSKGANKNCTIELKVPGKNEFVDLAVAFSVGAGDIAGQEGDGCLSGTLVSTITTDGVLNEVNFGTNSVLGTGGSGPDAIVMRITAHKDWTGYISQTDIRWSVS